MAPRRVNVFTIAPGTPFLARFIEALRAGDLVAGFPHGDDPLSLASATVLVPTQRAAQALRESFLATAGDDACVLPRIRTFAQLSDIDADPGAEDDADSGFVLPPSVTVTERRLVLTEFVQKWARTIRETLRDDSLEDRTALVAAAPAHAYRLAGDLAALIDELAIEGVAWERLADVTPDEFDEYWKLTLSFLKIATQGWADHLAENGLIDRVARQSLLVDAQVARLEAEGGGPVIAIGSTGTNKSTARLLGALARSPRGAIVLPGLDLSLDEAAWSLIGGDPAQRIEPSAGHPQAALFRLLKELALTRDDVVELGAPPASLAARADFLTQALRPADTTDVWAGLRAERDGAQFDGALADLALVEAEDEREEALALAIAMREALEHPERTALLITPDRSLAMRVRAELGRWGVEIDDSAGEPLRQTPLGSLARLLLDMVRGPPDVMALLALTAHSGLRLGRPVETVRKLSQQIEIGIARALLPGAGSLQELARAARATAASRDAHDCRKAIRPDEWDEIEHFLSDLDSALAPLRRLGDTAPLDAWATAHRDSFEALTAAGEEVVRPERHLVLDLFEDWTRPGAHRLQLGAYDYLVLVDQALMERLVRQVRPSHPRLQILGLLEARLLRADLVLLGGLDETVWPPQSQSGAFLNRPMRAQLGLTPPERRIGQTAHDFVQALGMPQVIISRARKRAGAPTVTSRLLQRMEALAGESWRAVRQRGDRLLTLARGFETPRPDHATRGGGRPSPRPPLDLRPDRLSVTRIEVLRRDPYSIYAERILDLKPLDPIGPQAGIRESGIVLHDVISRFSAQAGTSPSADATHQILAMAQTAFADFLAAPDFRAFQWPRIVTELIAYVRWERARRDDIARLYLEEKGSLRLPLFDGTHFDLTAQADRIEVHRDGTLHVIDFKSGRVPSPKEVAAGFAPQLVLEAAMLARGAFPGVEARDVDQAVYIKLGGDEGLTSSPVGGKKLSLQDLVPEQFDGLRALVEQFRNIETAYVSRPYPQFVSRYGRYDHLARVKEWSTTIGDG